MKKKRKSVVIVSGGSSRSSRRSCPGRKLVHVVAIVITLASTVVVLVVVIVVVVFVVAVVVVVIVVVVVAVVNQPEIKVPIVPVDSIIKSDEHHLWHSVHLEVARDAVSRTPTVGSLARVFGAAGVRLSTHQDKVERDQQNENECNKFPLQREAATDFGWNHCMRFE
ncbi:hypothetical protein ElyMa_003489400 [Elysia marginata]|uniref:Uncharacterized protein n=1 Tax=Elysia marginata TaxID=1093978 RepID=A0AAV4EEV7_9GAST|nr:hypothetical protein ElyMa_003489400 [Elysia marginata]